MIMVSFRIERTGQVEVRLKVEGIARRFSAVAAAHTSVRVCHFLLRFLSPQRLFPPPFLWTFDDKGSYYRRHRYRRDSRLLRISVGNECYS